jgi:hypothetical protein
VRGTSYLLESRDTNWFSQHVVACIYSGGRERSREKQSEPQARRPVAAPLHGLAPVARVFGLTVSVPTAANADRKVHAKRSIVR